MNDRELISFSVKEEDYGYQEREIIPFWKSVQHVQRFWQICLTSGKTAMLQVSLLNLWSKEVQVILLVPLSCMKKDF